MAEAGPCDMLVNCAGTNVLESVLDMTEAGYETVMGINLKSPLICAQEFARLRIDAGGGGVIVNVTSIAGHRGFEDHVSYAASKAGLAAHSETMRAELAQHGVHVVTVYPGPVDTPMAEVGWAAYESTATQRKLLPEGRPDELARLMRRAVERGDDRIIYPRVYGGLRYLSHLARFLIDKLPPSVMGR